MENPPQAADFLARISVAESLAARDKEGALRELVERLVADGVVADGEKALAVVLERERLGSTGIGEGIAMPHGKLPELNSVVAAFGRSRAGIPFESLDGEPAQILFLLLSPETSPSLHLKALARVSRLLKSRQFRQELLDAKDAGDIHAKIQAEDAGQ